MQRAQVEDRWIIEISEKPLGMVVHDEGGYVFHAAAPEVWSLDRQMFKSLGAASRAAKELFRAKQPPRAVS
jgi:hypothetical protein